MKIKLGVTALLVLFSASVQSIELFSDRNNKDVQTVYKTCGDILTAEKSDNVAVMITVQDALRDSPVRYGYDKIENWDEFIPFPLDDPKGTKAKLYDVAEYLSESCQDKPEGYHLWRLLPNDFFEIIK